MDRLLNVTCFHCEEHVQKFMGIIFCHSELYKNACEYCTAPLESPVVFVTVLKLMYDFPKRKLRLPGHQISWVSD